MTVRQESPQVPGGCLWKVGDGTCGDEPVGTITLKDRVGAARIPVCEKHKSEHNRKAAELRVSKR